MPALVSSTLNLEWNRRRWSWSSPWHLLPWPCLQVGPKNSLLLPGPCAHLREPELSSSILLPMPLLLLCHLLGAPEMAQGLAAPGRSQGLPAEAGILAPHGLTGDALSDWCSQEQRKELGMSPWSWFYAPMLSPSAAGIFLFQS